MIVQVYKKETPLLLKTLCGPTESLIGLLSHACKVVRSGRTFLRRLISASAQVEKKGHFVRLTECVQADL